MSKGKKYSDEIKEKAYARYGAGEAVGEISKALKVPYSTIKNWIKNKPPDNLDSLRDEAKKKFVERAGRIIDKGMELLEMRFDTAIEKEKELISMIDEIYSADGEIVSDNAKAEVVRKLRDLLVYDPKTIAVALATVYDKKDRAEERASHQDEDGGVIIMPEVKEKE